MAPKKLNETKDNHSFNEFLTSIEDLVRKIKIYYKRKKSIDKNKVFPLNDNLNNCEKNIKKINNKKKNIKKKKINRFKKNKVSPLKLENINLNNSLKIISLNNQKKPIKTLKKNIKNNISELNKNIKMISTKNIDKNININNYNSLKNNISITRAREVNKCINNDNNKNNKNNIINQISNSPKSPTSILKYNNKYSIHFGISDYKCWSKLPNAENDANALNNLFSKKFNFKSKILKGNEVTKNSIERSILSMKNILSKNDLLVITFSGHGTSIRFDNCIGGFIVPHDASKNSELSELVSMKSLSEWAGWLPCTHIVFLLDCCFSGLSQLRGSHRKSIYTISHLLNLKCRYVINAGNGNQKVHDGAIGQHSPFVQAILNSPVINDGQCSIKDLAEDIVYKVSELSNYRQTPISGTLPGDHGGCAFLAL